ncbi:glycosyltransferase family 2 protein [Agarivorans sp. QJM3NY_25]|uniref:glycosyltransferase family 2 protein n=1 Tax=Agarivorans sp. QJM3NY_25 TaxID=3421430 RepID=UPI003D7DBFF6
MNPRISVVTVSYNSEKTIEKTIQSVLSQTFTDFEYLIIDGGSTDSTIDIIKSYEGAFGGRLKWVSESDNGIYDAFNKGVNLAKGHYVGFINSDDWYELNALELVNNEFYLDKDLYYGMLRVWQNNVEVKTYINHPENISKESLAHPSVFIKKTVYESLGGYSLKYNSASDYDFFIRAISKGISTKSINRVIANFLRGGVSGTSLGYFETLNIKLKYGFISKYLYLYMSKRKMIIDFLRFNNIIK